MIFDLEKLIAYLHIPTPGGYVALPPLSAQEAVEEGDIGRFGDELERLAYQIIYQEDPADGKILYSFLKTYSTQQNVLPAARTRAAMLVIPLAFFLFDSLGVEEQVIWLATQFLRGWRMGVHMQEMLSATLDTLGIEENKFAYRAGYVRALEENNERFGDLTALASYNNSKSTLGNWLKLYESSYAQLAVRAGLQEVEFLDMNADCKKLKEQDRALLLEILKLADWLQFVRLNIEEDALQIPVDAPFFEVWWTILLRRNIILDQRSPEHWWTSVEAQADAQVRTAWNSFAATTLDPAPKNVATVLRFMLEQTLKESSRNVMKSAVNVLNLLKKNGFPQYMEIVYFDPADRQLHWKTY